MAADALEYAPAVPWLRRRYRLPILTILVLAAAYTLAMPRLRLFRRHLLRRGEIRQQFEAQVSKARDSLVAGKRSDAATALFLAEFPLRTESNCFARSELDRLKRQIGLMREQVIAQEVTASLIASVSEHVQEMERQREAEERRTRGEITSRCPPIIGCRSFNIMGALRVRATEQLRRGNNLAVLGVCEQIVDLDPGFQFDDDFWANAVIQP